jgi:hypothetical protein
MKTIERSRLSHGLLRCPHCWSLGLWAIGLLGIVSSLLVTSTPRRVEEGSLSTLGVDGRAATLFNGTLITVGLGFFVLAFLTYRVLHEMQRHKRLNTPRLYTLTLPLIFIGAALILAGCFHLDGASSTHIHILASTSSLATVIILMLTPPGFLGVLFGWTSRGSAAAIGGLLALSGEHLLTYTFMEIAVLILVGLWFCWLQIRLHASADQIR